VDDGRHGNRPPHGAPPPNGSAPPHERGAETWPAPTPPAAAALARLYDLDLADDPGDLDLYLALAARAGGPILELAVGTGRLAVPLAQTGHAVTGIDRDPAMLARARDRAAAAGPDVASRLRLELGDARHVRLSDAGSYRLAFVALNSLLLFGERDAQAAAVATMAAHLAPGGIAAVDVWLPDADDLGRYDGRIVLEYPRVDPETDHLVTKAASAVHDAATGTVRLMAIYEEGPQGQPPARWLRQDQLRLVSADDLSDFARAAGLTVELLAGGYDLAPLAPGAERAVLIAVKPG
jgi:SAM-dependent methyltransferase